jgi:hypothetical protein
MSVSLPAPLGPIISTWRSDPIRAAFKRTYVEDQSLSLCHADPVAPRGTDRWDIVRHVDSEQLSRRRKLIRLRDWWERAANPHSDSVMKPFWE